MLPVDHGGYECYLERPVMMLLRNNRYMYGTLKSYDQYNSVALNFAVERIFRNDRYAEKHHGLVVIRGENITLIGMGAAPRLLHLEKAEFEELAREAEEEKSLAG